MSSGLWFFLGAVVSGLVGLGTAIIGQHYEARKASRTFVDTQAMWMRDKTCDAFQEWLRGAESFALAIEEKYEEFEQACRVAQWDTATFQAKELELKEYLNELERRTVEHFAAAKLWASPPLLKKLSEYSALVASELGSTLGQGRDARETVTARLDGVHDEVLALMLSQLPQLERGGKSGVK